MTTFLHRVTGAALLNPAIYEEVEADRTATMQAMAVVALSSLAAGVGALGLASTRVTTLAGISLLAFAVWGVWALLTLQIGTRILPSPRTMSSVEYGRPYSTALDSLISWRTQSSIVTPAR